MSSTVFFGSFENIQILLFLSLVAVLVVPGFVFALDLGAGIAGGIAQQAGYSANTTDTTFSETLGFVVRTILSFVGVIFISLMVYAGFLWMTARGDEGKIETSQNIIRSSIIGLIITLGAYSITAFVLPRILSRTTGPSGGASGVGSTGVCCSYRENGQIQQSTVSDAGACISLCNGVDSPRSSCSTVSQSPC